MRKRIVLLIITLIMVFGSIYSMNLFKDTEVIEKTSVTKEGASTVDVTITEMTDMAEEIEYTITEDEVVNYCTDNFIRDVKVIERLSDDSYAVCFADDERIVFNVYASMRAGEKQPTYGDTMASTIATKTLEEIQIPTGLSNECNDPFIGFYHDIYDRNGINTIADYYYKILDKIKKLGKEDYNHAFLDVNIFHDYTVGRDKLIYNMKFKELDNMRKEDFITMLTEKYYNREDTIVYKVEDDIELVVKQLFERVDAYDKLGINFKLTVKPAWTDNDEYSVVFQSKNDLKLSKEEYKEKFEELYRIEQQEFKSKYSESKVSTIQMNDNTSSEIKDMTLDDIARLNGGVFPEVEYKNGNIDLIDGLFTDILVYTSEDAYNAIKCMQSLLKIDDVDSEIIYDRSDTNTIEKIFYFNQYYKGVEVKNHSIAVIADKNGNAYYLRSTYDPKFELDVMPTITENEAKRIAMDLKNCSVSTETQLVVFYPSKTAKAILTWEMYVGENNTYLVYVDAKTGSTVYSEDCTWTDTAMENE